MSEGQSTSPGELATESNFREDLRIQLLAELTTFGVPIADTANLDRILWTHRSLVLRRISPGVRDIVWSRELQAKSLPAKIAEGLARLAAVSLSGGDLLPFQSRELADPFRDQKLAEARSKKTKKKKARNGRKKNEVHPATWPDDLLNDWGIHHLHLGPIERTGFAEGADELLYVWIGDARLYFIDVLNHGAFADPTLLEIVLANWPGLLAPHRAVGVTADNLTKAERVHLRKSGMNAAITLSDGTVYFPPGGGQSSAKMNRHVVPACDYLLYQIDKTEAFCRTNPRVVSAAFERQRRASVADLRVRLVINDEGMFLDHLATGTRIRLTDGAPSERFRKSAHEWFRRDR